MLEDIVLLGNIGLKMLQENTGASGVRNGALEIQLRQGGFFLPRGVLIQCTVLYNPSSQPAAKSVGEPYDRAYSLLTDDSNLWEASGSAATAIWSKAYTYDIFPHFNIKDAAL